MLGVSLRDEQMERGNSSPEASASTDADAKSEKRKEEEESRYSKFCPVASALSACTVRPPAPVGGDAYAL